jgi:hypothetical protein
MARCRHRRHRRHGLLLRSARGNPDPRLHELRFGRAPTSTDCGQRRPIFPPVVCSVTPPARLISWFPSWFHAGATGACLQPLGPRRASAADAMIGIIVRLASACFRFTFDQAIRHVVQH